MAEAARAAPQPTVPRAPDRLLDGLAVMITEGHSAAAPLLQQALREFRDNDISANGGFRWLWLAQEAAQELWDHDTWLEFAIRQLQLVRDSGALTVLPLAYSAVIVAQTYAGELRTAAALIDEVDDRHRGDRQPARALRGADSRGLAGPGGRPGPARRRTRSRRSCPEARESASAPAIG